MAHLGEWIRADSGPKSSGTAFSDCFRLSQLFYQTHSEGSAAKWLLEGTIRLIAKCLHFIRIVEHRRTGAIPIVWDQTPPGDLIMI